MSTDEEVLPIDNAPTEEKEKKGPQDYPESTMSQATGDAPNPQ